ncbi:putative membrane domain protein, partial [Vibrio parahaemolyticus V-223/04]
STNKRSRKDRK